MITNRTGSELALAMMALPVLLGAPLCYLRPEATPLWAAGMFILPVSWLLIKAAHDRLGLMGSIVFPKAIPAGAMIFASLLLSVSLGAPLAAALGLIDNSSAQVVGARGPFVLAGCYFVLRGNRLPKLLTPWENARFDPVTLQTLQRLTGWAYVLAGFVLSVVWLVLPVNLALLIGVATIAVGILVPTFILRFHANRRPDLLNH